MARTTTTWLAIWLIVAAGRSSGAGMPCSPDRAAAHLTGEYSRTQPRTDTASGGHTQRSAMWWRGEDALIEFGIDKRRATELERIFQQTLPMLKKDRAEVARKEGVLSELLANAGTTNESAVVQAVEDLEVSRRALSRTYTMMQYRMYLRLTSSQRTKVHAYLNHVEATAAPRATSR